MTINVVTDEQLGILARRQHDLFRRVREGTLPVGQILEGLQCLIEGRPLGTHIINLDEVPYIPDRWTLAEPEHQIASRATGILTWDPANVRLHLDPAQMGDGHIVGTELAKKLEGQPVLPANVLDYLLDHQTVIPSDWKGKYVYFWTVYRGGDGRLYVRCLYWGGGHWDWGCGRLDDDWHGLRPAAVSAS